jgi:type VI secretion system protein ImpE
MNAQQLFKAGKLSEAISALNENLRNDPSDNKSRTFLFELLSFAGEYDRAEKQLDLLEGASKDAMLGALLYRGALNGERTRREMFANKDFPSATSPKPVSGKLNGKEFQKISDADERIGGRLEIFAAGDYLWIAFEDISLIEIEPPKRLRDLLWIPAKLKTGPSFRSRELGEVLLPAISPQSSQHPDDEVRLGRVSEWCEDETGEVAPFGQKTLLVDDEEVPVLEIRTLEIHAQPEAVTA